jgi:hypothetical protein
MTTPALNRDSLIAALAHRIWEEEGHPHGRAEQHWLRAAGLVDTELTLPDVTPKAKKSAARKTRKG